MIKLPFKKIAIFACLLVIFASNLFNFTKDDKIWRAENVRAATSCKGPADVILVIDRSATMADSLKFSAAKSASVNFIDKLFATEPDSSYGSCAYHQIGLVAFNNNIDSESLNQSGSLIQNIINQSDGILGGSYPSDYRRTSTAIEIAKNKLDPDLSSVNSCATKTMIVLTDGAPYYDIASARAHADSAKSKDIRIVSVGLKLDEIVDPAKRTEAEDFIRYISSTPSDCYYVSESGNALDGCTSISGVNLETALDGVYNNITAAVCDESPPSVEIYRTPQNTLYSVDSLVIKSVATDDIGFESHTLRWSDNWANPDEITEIACGNLSGTVIECNTEDLGPFSMGSIIGYRSMAKDANGNEASIDLPDPRSVTVANVSLNVPALFRNVNNAISVTVSDPNGKANLDSFYITIDAPILAGVEIEKAEMSCSGLGDNRTCAYDFNPGCDWTDGITGGMANNINVNMYIYADSDDMAIRQIASAENQLLVSSSEGSGWPGTCSDGINNDCDYKDNDPLQPIIDLNFGLDEMLCDVTDPGIGILRDPSGDVYDLESDGTTPMLVTLESTTGDSNGIKQHTIYYREDGGVWQTAFDCNDANVDDLCDEDASQNIANISATIGPFAAGTVVEYYSTTVDYSGNDNTGNSATESFIVKNRECFEKNDLDDCNVTPDGKCCEGVCNAAISNPNSYNTDYCAEEVCNGISWEWNIDSSKNNVICSDGGNSDGCYEYNPTGYFWDGGCEERGYTCSSGYCTYGVINRNEDHCIGGGSLTLNDYECVGNSCALDPSPAIGNDVCDVNLDYLSVNAYNSDNAFICGSSGAATGEVLDNLTNNVSLESITYDGNGIRGQKIYWKEISEASYNINNCNVDSCGDISNQCNCSQNIGPFNIGETVAFYASSKDDSPNQTENIMGSAGLRYYYYDGTNFNTYLGSDIDTDIDHNWGSGQVNINGNSWENQSSTVSIIWDGMITPDVLGVHTFYLYSDDGIRFDLGGNRLIDHWGYDNNEYSATYDFVSLEPVSIRIEWYEGWGAANLRLGWESPGGVKTYPIPSGNLIAPYSFTVRDGECYDVINGNEPNLTPCDSGNGMCCGGSCDSSVSSTSYDEECRVDSCSGTNWVYAAGNENDPCGSTDSCFDYYSPNISFYSGCITGGNECSSGYCAVSSSLTSVPACNGNLLTNYSCDPDSATGTCLSKDSDIDCSTTGNYDSDSVPCNCDCNGYDFEEKVYSSLDFNGMNDYVEIPNNSSLNPEEITLEAWVYPTNFYYYGNIINKRYPAQYILRFYSNTGRVQGYIYNGGWRSCTTSSGVAASLNQWNHIVHTYDGIRGRVYINNVEGCAYSYAGAINSGSSILKIGSYYTNADPRERIEGMIDEVRIYSRALYPEEVEDHYNGIFVDDTGLVGHWDFDEGTGEIVGDSSGNGNGGSLNNVDGILGSGSYNPSWDTGVYGDGLDFDGGDYVALNNLGLSTSTDSKVSVEFWMNWSGGNDQMPFGWNSYDLWFYDGSFGFNTFNSDIWGVSSSGLSNEWIHVIAIFNNGDAKLSELYLDGNKQSLSQRNGSTGSGTISSNARISGYSGGSGYRFDGLIDEVRIYNRALSDAEAANHYKGIFSDNSDLIGYWNFNEGSGAIAYDSSENGPQWVKYHHDSISGISGNVPVPWQVCTDGKNNDCDEIANDYDNVTTGISNCDGEVDGVFVVASAEDRDGIENSNLFDGNLVITTYDVDIERIANDFTITASATDDFLIQQTIIEWTTDNWANKSEKICDNTGFCEVCIEGGNCGEDNDLIFSSSLSAGKIFNFRVCAWDDSINHNKKCSDYHGIIILGSNLVPEITPLSVQEPNFCAGLSYALNWNFVDPDDGQASYKIQVEEGDSDFTDAGKLVIDAEKYLTEDSYLIPNSTDSDFISGKSIEYGKTYNWRVKVTDDRGGGYEQTTEWEKGPSFTAPEYEYPQVDFSADSDHSGECLYEIGYSDTENRCDFGEDIVFSDDSTFIECTDSDNKQCLTASAAKCDTANNICVPCGSNDECVKFKSLPNVNYSCNAESGICEASGSCLSDDDCKAADVAKCDTELGSCIFCDNDLQCTNDKFGTAGIDYFCNSNGKCEDREHRKWYFYDDINIDSADPNPVNNYIDSVVDSYVITLEIKDVLGNSCYKKKNIFLGGKKYPKWNEMSPSSN